MAKESPQLTSRTSPDSITPSNEKPTILTGIMALNELRVARQFTQEQLAELLKINQAAVSKMERRTYMHVSTLMDFIEAIGGEVEITAKFPEGIVRIRQFHRQ